MEGTLLSAGTEPRLVDLVQGDEAVLRVDKSLDVTRGNKVKAVVKLPRR